MPELFTFWPISRRFALEVQRGKACRGCNVREGFKEEALLELLSLIAGAVGARVRTSESSADRGCVRFWSKGKKVSYVQFGG